MNSSQSNSFCGDSQFWNTSEVEASWYPKLSECFQQTALAYGPCGWLWLTSGFHVAYLYNHKHYISLSTTHLHIARLAVAMLLCVASGIHFIIPFKEDQDYPPSFFVSQGLWVITFILACLLMVLSRKSGVTSPCVVCLFWLFALVARIIPLYSVIFEKVYEIEKLRFSLEVATFGLVLIEFSLQLCGDSKVWIIHRESFKIPCPAMHASYVSKLTYTWVYRLVYLGYKRVVVLGDIFDVPGHMQCRHSVPAFTAAWNKELQKLTSSKERDNVHSYLSMKDANGTVRNGKIQGNHDESEPTEKTRLLPQSSHSDESDVTVKSGKKGGKPSLIWALAKVYSLPLFKAQVVGMGADALLYVNPILLGQLIAFVEDKGTDEFPKWKGYILAVAFFVVVLGNSMMSNYRFFTCTNIGQSVQTVLTAAVYKKSLVMNADARRNFTVGTIVNLMAVDCPRFRDMVASLYVLVSWPFQMSIAFYMLHEQLGIAFLAGLVIILLLIPANALITTLLRRAQARQLVLKDQRIKLVNEILNGVKVLKLYAWESSFQEKILELRRLEVIELRKGAVLASVNTLFWIVSPVLLTLLSFVSYVLITGESLTPSKAFIAMNLINNMRIPMNTLPGLISQIVQCQVSIARLQSYLSGEELDDRDNGTSSHDFPFTMRNATFTWDRTITPVLQNLSIKVPRGKLIAIVGPVGAGKSSLISAMLGEMEQLTGQNSMIGQVAYVPQQAWIQNMTLQNNILFEKQMEEDFYRQVIDACALESDIELLPGGEQTEIGEKGINLSGGQKQRVSLARAVYQDADIYLLDDPLSAVDAHVGKHIFQNVVGPQGMLRDKTRVMVTHGIHWLPLVDSIIVMDQGKITEAGSYQELMTHDGPFAQFVRTYLIEHQNDELDDPEVVRMQEEIKHQVDSVTSDEEQIVLLRRTKSEPHKDGHCTVDRNSPRRSISAKEVTRPAPEEKTEAKRGNRLIEDERVEVGQVRSAVYLALLRSFGYLQAVLVCVFLFLYNGANMASGIWLSEWTSDTYLGNQTHEQTEKYKSKTFLYLGVYAGITSVQMICNGLFVLLVYTQMVTASQRLHNSMLNSILHQPMAFFDTTPVGRILNRFSRDVDVLDFSISRQLRLVLQTFFNLIVIVVIVSYSTPVFLVVVAPVMVIYILFQRFYIPSSRQFRRLESSARSPIFSHFAETINGASSIRAYGACDRFILDSQYKVDENQKCSYVSNAAARWLKVRLEFLASILVFFACLFAVTSTDISPSLVGLSIMYALQVTAALNMLVQNLTMLETNTVSGERIVEYIGLRSEPAWIKPQCRPSSDWPEHGKISFQNYSTRYRPELDLVLKGISFSVKKGQKIGIVGRTGAGKSSLSMALFRVIEAAGGSIVIDDLDISSIGLHDLRDGLTILPQDPVLFSGSVRFNLDPFDQYSDSAIWEALDHAHLGTFIRDLPDHLEYVCEEGGQNLSVGQRQLMCLARSLLRKSRILVLDEATAAVDLETDALLQDTIRQEFRDCTVLTVAHRLNTVIDYDKILVLGNGEILEFGSPSELLARPNGTFYSMAKEAGLVQ